MTLRDALLADYLPRWDAARAALLEACLRGGKTGLWRSAEAVFDLENDWRPFASVPCDCPVMVAYRAVEGREGAATMTDDEFMDAQGARIDAFFEAARECKRMKGK